MDAQDNLDDAVPPVGRELYGGPENHDADGAYYMGGVNNGRGLGMGDFKCAACTNDFEVLEVEFTDKRISTFPASYYRHKAPSGYKLYIDVRVSYKS